MVEGSLVVPDWFRLAQLDQSYSPQPTNNYQNPTLTRLRIQSRYMVIMKIPGPPCSFPIQVSGDKLSCTYKGSEYSKSSEKLINLPLAAWDFPGFSTEHPKSQETSVVGQPQ